MKLSYGEGTNVCELVVEKAALARKNDMTERGGVEVVSLPDSWSLETRLGQKEVHECKGTN